MLNYVSPNRLPLLVELRRRLPSMSVLLSTPMEPDRCWKPDWAGVEAVVQRTLSRSVRRSHPSGFEERREFHVLLDTLRHLRRTRPRVVISLELGLRSLLAAVHRAANPGSRLILWLCLSERSERGCGRIREAWRRLILASADAVLVNGAGGARYAARLGVPEEKVFLAPYVTDSERFTPRTAARKEPARRLLTVGQLIPRKGLLGFRDALATWARRSERAVTWTLIGTGPQAEALRGGGLPENLKVRCEGHVPYEDLPSRYRRSDIFVFPTLVDEWGTVVNEAMASGLPVLGSEGSQAVTELVEDGVSGWRFAPDSPGEAEGALARAMEAPPERLDSMGRAATSAASRLTPGRVADRMLEGLRYACGRKM